MSHLAVPGPETGTAGPVTLSAPVLTGLDVLVRDGHPRLQGRRIGLLVNQASVDRACRHATDLLCHRDDFRVLTVFGPQHGLWGTTQDNMIEWEGGPDARLGVPVHSLYGRVRRPSREMLEGLEAMVIDLFDVGSRYYTFVWTATLVDGGVRRGGHSRGGAGSPPTPSTAWTSRGRISSPRTRRSWGASTFPCATASPWPRCCACSTRRCPLGCDLTVIPVEGWRRSMWFDQTGLPWAMPSPNMPCLETAVVYPGMCLFEGTDLSEGRGTTRPFELCGVPGLDAHALVESLAEDGLPGCFFRPLYFEPTFQKCARQTCGGVFIHVTDRAAFRPVRTAVALIARMRAARPGALCLEAASLRVRDRQDAHRHPVGQSCPADGHRGGAHGRRLRPRLRAERGRLPRGPSSLVAVWGVT